MLHLTDWRQSVYQVTGDQLFWGTGSEMLPANGELSIIIGHWSCGVIPVLRRRRHEGTVAMQDAPGAVAEQWQSFPGWQHPESSSARSMQVQLPATAPQLSGGDMHLRPCVLVAGVRFP